MWNLTLCSPDISCMLRCVNSKTQCGWLLIELWVMKVIDGKQLFVIIPLRHRYSSFVFNTGRCKIWFYLSVSLVLCIQGCFNPRDLVAEYWAYGIMMNKIFITENMGIQYCLFPNVSCKYFQYIYSSANSVKTGTIANTFYRWGKRWIQLLNYLPMSRNQTLFKVKFKCRSCAFRA